MIIKIKNKKMSSKISENGISILSQLPNEPGKKNLINTDVILQICATPKSEQSKNNIFSVSMMDMHQKYTGFLVILFIFIQLQLHF